MRSFFPDLEVGACKQSLYIRLSKGLHGLADQILLKNWPADIIGMPLWKGPKGKLKSHTIFFFLKQSQLNRVLRSPAGYPHQCGNNCAHLYCLHLFPVLFQVQSLKPFDRTGLRMMHMKAEAERHPKKGSSALCPLLTVVLVGTCFHLDHLGNSTGSLSKSQVPGHYGTIHIVQHCLQYVQWEAAKSQSKTYSHSVHWCWVRCSKN